MKKYKQKLLTFLSVLAIGTGAAMGAAADPLSAGADEVTYSASSVLTAANSASVTSDTYNGTSYAAMVFRDGSTVSYKQDLAYRWFTEEGAQYFSIEFALGSTSFTSLTMTFESAENSKTEDDKTTNTITFLNSSGNVSAQVNEEESVSIDAGSPVSVSFYYDENGASGEYEVFINGASAGYFTNIGGYFAEYSATTLTPLTFKAKTEEALTVYMISMNGQSFATNDEGKIVDDASPVLVVNQDVKAFRLGAAFTLEYEVIDVLDATVSKTLEYYQYEEGKDVNYSTLSTSTYFFETDTFEQYGKEFVSVKMTLNDDDSSHTAVYDLSWYAAADDVTTFDGVGYISVTIDTDGPYYTCIDNDSTAATSTLDEENEAYLDYIQAVEEAAEGLQAGSGRYFYLPSLEDLIEDEGTTYSSLTFTIYYKTQDSDSSNSYTSRTSSNLTIELTSAGIYSFRVVATDDSGNTMRLYNNGRLVKITSDNVWDIDAIPEFTFSVYNYGISVDEAEKESTGYVDQTYNFSDFEIKGLSGYSATYSLYYFEGAYEQYSYEDVIEMANSEEGLEAYLTATDGIYLRKISVFDSSIDEDDDEDKWDASDNPYYWYGAGASFKPQEQGFYVLRLEVIDSELWGDKVIAYKIIEVESDEDVMYGETYWLRDNYVTVIAAGVGLLAVIGIIVLSVVKPKEEDIEDIEVTEIGGKASKKKKTKKAKDKKKTEEDLD